MLSKVTASLVRERSRITDLVSKKPLKVLVPGSRNGEYVQAILSNYGGGFVAGDKSEVEILCEEGALLFVGQQANGRVYKNPNGYSTSMNIMGTIGSKGSVVQYSEPLVLHKGADFVQTQHWDLAEESSFANIEIVSGGRIGNGESFNFKRLLMQQEIYSNQQLLYKDVLKIEPDRQDPSQNGMFGAFYHMLNIIVMGKFVEGTSILDADCGHAPNKYTLAVAPLVCGGVSVRALSLEVSSLEMFVKKLMQKWEQQGLFPNVLKRKF